jgi:hypothetical protein
MCVNFAYLQMPLALVEDLLAPLTKARRLASYKINYLLSGNVYGLPALSKARIEFKTEK